MARRRLLRRDSRSRALRTSQRGLAVGLFASAVALAIVPSSDAGTLDQSQPAIWTTVSTPFSDTERDGQTFTSGITGALDQVDLAVGRAGPSITAPLVVEVRPVSGGVPSGPPLASVNVAAASVPETTFPSGFLSIPFASPAPVTAGVQYAIVVTSASCGFRDCYNQALNPLGDSYPAGAGIFSGNGGATWVPVGFDFPFKTYVLTSPTSKQQCKKGGWRKFRNPSFKNQGQCVKWANHRGGKGDKPEGEKGNGHKGKKKGGKKK